MAQEVEIFIAGGAAAGLCIASYLQRTNITYVVMEQNKSSGDVWRNRYHRLHLHDIIEECHLPHLPMPKHYPVYANRIQFADYLDLYGKEQNLNIKYEHEVKNAKFEKQTKNWIIKVEDKSNSGVINEYIAKHLIIASGIYNKPIIPTFLNQEKFNGTV